MFMKEIWADINGYEGFYQVSNLGNVRSLDRVVTNYLGSFIKKGKPKSLGNLTKGYKGVLLCKDGIQKTYKVHRLVAEAFLPNPNNLPQVNHKDEDKSNNMVWVNEDGSIDYNKSNLEWCDNKYNINYSFSKSIYSINLNTGEYRKYPSLTDAAEKTGINKTSISNVLKNKRNKAGECIWKYYNTDEYLIGVMNYNINKRKGVA